MGTQTVRAATEADIDGFVASVAGLFRDDAGRYDPHADVTWPLREGLAHYSAMLTDPRCLMAVALDGDRMVGHLVGKVYDPSPTRLVRVAEVEDLYVEEDARGHGHGTRMMAFFVDWATATGAVTARVSAYAANEGAQRFYRRHGFAPASITLGRPLGPAG